METESPIGLICELLQKELISVKSDLHWFRQHADQYKEDWVEPKKKYLGKRLNLINATLDKLEKQMSI